MPSTNESMPWYREPWPWLLMAGPVAAIVAGAYTMVLAVRSDDGLVAEDYYKQGMAINRQLAREEFARSKHISAQVDFTGDGVRVVARSDIALAPTLRLRIVHPTRAGEDIDVLLSARGAGEYAAGTPPISREARRLILEDPAATWRIAGSLEKSGGGARLEP